jgi:hypothetical protein
VTADQRSVGHDSSRVDPLYRTLGASLQSDIESNSAEVKGSVGVLTLQGRVGRARDNLAQIASILTTRTNQLSLNAAMPLSAVVGPKDAWYLPVLSIGRDGTHQYGDGLPTNGSSPSPMCPTGECQEPRQDATKPPAWRFNVGARQPAPGRSSPMSTHRARDVARHHAAVVDERAPRGARERQKFLETAATQELDRIGAIVRWS